MRERGLLAGILVVVAAIVAALEVVEVEGVVVDFKGAIVVVYVALEDDNGLSSEDEEDGVYDAPMSLLVFCGGARYFFLMDDEDLCLRDSLLTGLSFPFSFERLEAIVSGKLGMRSSVCGAATVGNG